MGFPGETKQEARNTIHFAKELNPTYASFSILTPDYGTKLYKEAVDNKWIDGEIRAFDSSSDTTMDAPGMSIKEKKQVLNFAYLEYYLRPSKIIDFLKDVKSLVNFLGNGVHLVWNRFLLGSLKRI